MLKPSDAKPLDELTAAMIKNEAYLMVETQGLVYRVRFKPASKIYTASAEDGEYFECSTLDGLKKELKADAKPFVSCSVSVNGKVVGHIMNQHNWFFYRPVDSTGDLDTQKQVDPDSVFDTLAIPGSVRVVRQ
jgi:hypothetical protein